jgi:hypothetical protein
VAQIYSAWARSTKVEASISDELGRNECKSIDVANAVRGAKRSSDSRVEVPAADVGDRVKHDGEREAERGGGDGKLKMKLENHGGKKSGLTPKAKGPTYLKSGLRVR